MARAWIFVAVAGLAFAGLEPARAMPVALGALSIVVMAVALALIAHGGRALAAHAVAFGAAGALAFELVRPLSIVLASGALLLCVFGTRAVRSRSAIEAAVRTTLPACCGAGAAWIASSYGDLPGALFVVAIAVAALIAALPFVVPSEAPRSFALRRLATRAKGPLRVRLLRAVAAHARMEALDLPARLRRRVERTFDEVILKIERRLERGATERVDPPVKDSIDQLHRLVRAARSREALLDGLELSASPVANDSDTLEAEVAALAELEHGAAARETPPRPATPARTH